LLDVSRGQEVNVIEPKVQTVVFHQMRAEHCFAYLIADAETHDAALIDPRADRVADYLRELTERGLRLRFVIETHTHADHLSGAAELRARTGAEVLLSERARSEVATRRLRDGDRELLGGLTIEVVASPGHTDDSLSLRVDGTLLTGDALLVGGAGRTDFQNGCTNAWAACPVISSCTQPTTMPGARIRPWPRSGEPILCSSSRTVLGSSRLCELPTRPNQPTWRRS
jgi:beta-lactamase superfamily II metal-dependent hydrolase